MKYIAEVYKSNLIVNGHLEKSVQMALMLMFWYLYFTDVYLRVKKVGGKPSAGKLGCQTVNIKTACRRER